MIDMRQTMKHHIMNKNYYTVAATAAGGLLATMILLNGILSKFTSPFYSSFIVHLVGLAGSLILWIIMKPSKSAAIISRKAPFWSYLGGIGGALAVVCANTVVNSSLGLAGSLSCFILGQTATSLLIDGLGLFGAPKRKLVLQDGIRVGSILAGSLLIINAGYSS